MKDQAKLDEIARSMKVDGYNLVVQESGDTVSAVVTADEGVCDDCLVPKNVLAMILAPVVGTEPDHIEITYPPEA